ncbi:MAG: phage tail tape measure protein [Nitrososphaerota archaeon]
MTVSEFTLKAIFTAEDRISSHVERIQNSLGELASTGERSGGRLSAAMEAAGRVAEIALGFTLASAVERAIDFARESVEAFARLEHRVLQLAAAARGAGQDINSLASIFSTVASAASREYAVTAEEAAAAMEALIKAGLSGVDAINALGAAIMLAKNEGASFAEAGNNLVQVLAQFGLEGGEAIRVVDALTNASRLGIGTANDYAQGLANAAATAKSLGLSLEDTIAWLVVLERRLGSADEAGTALNRFLLDLRQIAMQLGVPLADASGKLRDMQEVILDVVAAVRGAGGNIAQLQDQLKGVDMRALKALLTLSQMTESFEELRGEVSKGGSAMETFAAALDSTTGRLERQRAEIDRWQRSIGEALSGIYTMVGPMMLKVADSIVTPWRGIIAYFTGDEFQQLSAAIETQLHILGRISEEEAAQWIMSWVEAGRITREEALQIAGSMLSLSTIAKTELRTLLEEAMKTGENMPESLRPLVDAFDSMASSATQSRAEIQSLAAGIKDFVADAGIIREAADMFANYYDVVVAVEQALGREVQLTEEAEQSKARLSATTQLLSMITESFNMVQQAMQMYLLGGKEAGDLLMNTLTTLTSAVEDGIVTNEEFSQILQQLGIDSQNVAGSLYGILRQSLDAVRAAVEENTNAVQGFMDAINQLNGMTAHTYHYHHQIIVTEETGGGPTGGERTSPSATLSPEPVIPPERRGMGPIPLQTGAWNIPRDTLAHLHRGEMVLPRPVAEWFRRSGATRTINVNVKVNAGGSIEADKLASLISRVLVKNLRAM